LHGLLASRSADLRADTRLPTFVAHRVQTSPSSISGRAADRKEKLFT
jgi:hypothetical protein